MTNIDINNIAQQIYSKLNAQDGVNDDNIGLKSDGSYDNSIWNNFANEAGGSQVKNYIKGENALKSIRTYLQRAMNDAAKLAKIALAGGVQIEGAEEAQATPEQREIPESITKDFEDAKANVRAQMYDCFGGLPQAEAIRPLMGLVETPVTESLAAEIVVPQLVTAEEAVMPEAEPGNVYEEFSEEPSQLVVAKEVVSEYETGGIYPEITADGTEYIVNNNDGTISITKDGETETRPMTDEEKALDPQQLVANLEAAKATVQLVTAEEITPEDETGTVAVANTPILATAEEVTPEINTGAVYEGYAEDGTGVSINFKAGTVTVAPENGEPQVRDLTDDEKKLSPGNLLTKLINDVNTPPVSDVDAVEVNSVEVSNLTNVNLTTQEYLANDANYQKYVEQYNTLRIEIANIENEYEIEFTGNRMYDRGVISRISNVADKEKYHKYTLLERSFAKDLDSYKNVMAEWQDGHYADTFSRNGVVYTNVEAITLNNGQRAWKSDEGVFFPAKDGKIGNKLVPEEMIPTTESLQEVDAAEKMVVEGSISHTDGKGIERQIQYKIDRNAKTVTLTEKGYSHPFDIKEGDLNKSDEQLVDGNMFMFTWIINNFVS